MGDNWFGSSTKKASRGLISADDVKLFTPRVKHLVSFLRHCLSHISTTTYQAAVKACRRLIVLDLQVVWGGVIELADLLSSIWVKQLIYYTGGFVITNHV